MKARSAAIIKSPVALEYLIVIRTVAPYVNSDSVKVEEQAVAVELRVRTREQQVVVCKIRTTSCEGCVWQYHRDRLGSE